MSCRQSALSKGIEAFISRMIADGPSANRPPHMVLEPALSVSRSLKLAVLGVVVMAPVVLGGCNRESGEKAQQQASAQASTAAIPTDPVEPKGLSGAIDYTHKDSPLPAFSLTDAA